MLENSPADATQLPTDCQPECLAKPARRHALTASAANTSTPRAPWRSPPALAEPSCALFEGPHFDRFTSAFRRNSRMTWDRLVFRRAANSSICSIIFGGKRTGITGSRPVAGRPRFFGNTDIDLRTF